MRDSETMDPYTFASPFRCAAAFRQRGVWSHATEQLPRSPRGDPSAPIFSTAPRPSSLIFGVATDQFRSHQATTGDVASCSQRLAFVQEGGIQRLMRVQSRSRIPFAAAARSTPVLALLRGKQAAHRASSFPRCNRSASWADRNLAPADPAQPPALSFALSSSPRATPPVGYQSRRASGIDILLAIVFPAPCSPRFTIGSRRSNRLEREAGDAQISSNLPNVGSASSLSPPSYLAARDAGPRCSSNLSGCASAWLKMDAIGGDCVAANR